MIKKHFPRATVILVCAIFLFFWAADLNSTEKKASKPISLSLTKNCLRVIGALFPFFASFTSSIHDVTSSNKEFNDEDINLTLKPSVEASSNTPKTKD